MTLAYWFLLIAGLLPYGLVKFARGKTVANGTPRDGYAQLEGVQKRAYAAHLNSFEVFPLFAAAMLAAMLAGLDSLWLDVLAGAWLLSRGVYIYAYLKDRASLRSAAFGVGLVICIVIFTMPLWVPYPTM